MPARGEPPPTRSGTATEGDSSDQELKQDEAQRIRIGASVDGLLGGSSAGVERLQMLRRHVGERAAEAILADLGIERDVEVGEKRTTVLVDKDVGRLHIAVDHPLAVGVGQRLGETGADPAGNLVVVARLQKRPIFEAPEIESGRFGAQRVERFEEDLSVERRRRALAEGGNQLSERDAGDELHRQESQVLRGIDRLGEDADDVTVIEAGQHAGLATLIRGRLQSHEPIEGDLPGQVYPGEAAGAE